MMRAEAVAVVAGMYDDRLVSQTASFQTSKNRADALIDQRHKAKVPLFDASVFFERDPEEQLTRQAFSIEDRFRLLSFVYQTIP